jgi:phage terminase small subunit
MTRAKKNRLPKPPKYLRAATRRWWAVVVNDYELEERHLMILTMAGEFWDEHLAANEVLAKEGLTYDDRFGAPKPRPEVAIARDSRLGYARLMRELSLDIEPPAEFRVPRLAGTGS